MANICCSYITIDVDDDQYSELDKLYQRINEQDETLLKTVGCLTNSRDYGLVSATQDDEGTIHLDISSKYVPPDKELIALSKFYPYLRISVVSEEPGNDYYAEQEYFGGVQECDSQLSALDYLTKYHPEFTKERKYVERLSSKKAVEYILDVSEGADPRYDALLEHIALKRVSYVDLPLLINHEWRETNGCDSEKEYKHRLATASI